MTALIYKILRPAEWSAVQKLGQLSGTPVDIADGFIHFSTAAQARETAARHFSGESELILLAVEPDRLSASLKWEPSRGGELFPHLYAALPLDHVVGIYRLSRAADGTHLFPAETGI